MIELLTTHEMAEADRMAGTAGVPGATLMEAAGTAVARSAQAGLPAGAQAGFEVRLALLGARDSLSGDAAAMAALWTGEVEPMAPERCDGVALIVDALFGAGLARPLEGAAAAMVEAINASGATVVAVDVPSGLDGTTGRAAGPVVQADRTVTFFRRKPGHMLLPGRALCGALEVAQIGIPDAVLGAIQPNAFANEPDLWRAALRWPAEDGHKYDRGHALVVGGAGWKSGAARLRCRSTRRS